MEERENSGAQPVYTGALVEARGGTLLLRCGLSTINTWYVMNPNHVPGTFKVRTDYFFLLDINI